MPSLKDIKRRIGTVKSTQKITNAMKLVSASKFARAMHAVQSSQPYGKAIDQLVETTVGSLGTDFESKLIGDPDGNRVMTIVVGSDRGLCGGMNTNVFKKVDSLVGQDSMVGNKVCLVGWGRRAIQYTKNIKNNHITVREGNERVLVDVDFASARELGYEVLKAYQSGNFDRVVIAYPRFRSAIEQIPTIKTLLPFKRPAQGQNAVKNILMEPKADKIIDKMLERWFFSTIHRILLDSAASEHGARMSAMDSATNNAKEVQKKLTLQYNRARQAAITTELTEIISGAEALN